MRGIVRRIALFGILGAALLPLAAPSTASDNYREFYGRIDRINKKKMIVDNRMGDKVSFVPAEEPEVVDARGTEGRQKSSWKDLKKNDWVSVSWKMIDKPRKAYIIKVMPEKAEAGEDVE